MIGFTGSAIMGAAGAAAAFAGATIVTGLSGGNLGQALRAGVIAGATAIAFFGVGEATAHEMPAFDSPKFDPAVYAENVAGHALVGCASSAASGGSCQSGALSGAVTAAAGPLINGQRFEVALVENAVIGGAASVAGGGKFANGAVTGAFGYLFNYLVCDHGSCYGDDIKKGEMDAHYRDGSGWPVYAGSMDPSWLDSSQFDAIPIGKQGLIHTDWLQETTLDALVAVRNIGDRNIYGDFTATRVDSDHFLWNDTYNFDVKPGFSVRNLATRWGALMAGQGQGGTGFAIIGISPVRIPGR